MLMAAARKAEAATEAKHQGAAKKDGAKVA